MTEAQNGYIVTSVHIPLARASHTSKFNVGEQGWTVAQIEVQKVITNCDKTCSP